MTSDGTQTVEEPMMNTPMYGIGFAPSWHRPHLRYLEGEQGGGAPAAGNEGGEGEGEPSGEAKTFTQTELDRIVSDRLKQQAKNKFGDYDDLKAKAAGAQTLEDRVGSLESELASTRTDATRLRVAAKFGISTERGENDAPSDADLFLTGSDEAAMTAQAERLAGRASKKGGNRAPKEGPAVTTSDPKTAAKREWLQSLNGE